MFGLIRFKKKRKHREKRAKPRSGARLRELGRDDMRQLLETLGAYRAAYPEAPPLAVTVAGRRDGGGAQALAIVSAMLWARAMGARYLHTPFARVAHAIGTREEWAKLWEPFLNLGRGEVPVPPDARLVSLDELARNPGVGAQPGAVVAAPAFHWREFQTDDALHSLRSPLRRKYYALRKSGIPVHGGPTGVLTAAVHVRRGDITLDHPLRRHFYTRDEPILKTIQSVCLVADALGRPVHINIFSEGPLEMFGAFAAAGCTLQLDGDPFEAFHNLVEADILIQAKSSFSYIAGLISTGVVLHEPYVGHTGEPFYRPAPGWIVRDGAGAFDTEELGRVLQENEVARVRWSSRPLQLLRKWL